MKHQKTANSTFVLNLAPNGIIPTRELTPHVPLTPIEVANDIDRCMNAGGITYVHLHARDKNGNHTPSKSRYADFIEPIRERFPELVICVSCSGRLDNSFESRSDVLLLEDSLKPEMASLTLSSLNFPTGASINDPNTIIRLAEKMQERNIKPELEIFDLGMMNFAHYMIQKGYLKAPYYFNFILGNIFSAQSTLAHAGALLNELPENSMWAFGGIGNSQLSANMMALSQGGGIRTGIEDNLWYDSKRTNHASNEALVKRIHEIATLSEKQMMSSTEFRAWLTSPNLTVIEQ